MEAREPRLVCVECGAVADEGALGWRAYLTEEEDDEPVETVVFCPACAEREFGYTRWSAT